MHEALAAIQRDDLALEEWGDMALRCAGAAVKAMELLDRGNTETYRHPVPAQVPLEHKKGRAILISGHDLQDLEELLKQTAGKGINIYTHVDCDSLRPLSLQNKLCWPESTCSYR